MAAERDNGTSAVTKTGRAPVAALSVVAHAAAPAAGLGVGLGVGLGGWTLLAAPALAGATAAAVATWLRARRQRTRFDEPLRAALAQVRSGGAVDELPHETDPLLADVVGAMNQSLATLAQAQRMSQASLLSVEGAFDRVHAVLQSLAEGVILVDRRSRIVMANPGARTLLAGDGPSVEGQEVGSMLPPELAAAVRRGLEELAAGEEPAKADVVGLEVGARFYDVSIAPVLSAKAERSFGSVVGIVDVTRNHEVARLKEQFLSSVSHELRTPLTNICSFTEILEQLSPDSGDDWREFIGIVSTESHRLRSMVEDMFEHHRVVRGELELTLGAVDLTATLMTAVEAASDRAAQRGIVVDVALDEDLPEVVVDVEAVRQVLDRLLDNAIKFAPERGRVRVSAIAMPDRVELVVEDDGAGVPDEQRQAIFDGFRQVGDVMTDKPAGAGLGLAICRGLVGAMHGEIACAASELGGARLTVALPSAGVASGAMTAAPEAGIPESGEAERGHDQADAAAPRDDVEWSDDDGFDLDVPAQEDAISWVQRAVRSGSTE